MVSIQDANGLSGAGEIVLNPPWAPERVIVTVTNIGQARGLDADVVSRYAMIGWWSFEDQPMGPSTMYFAHPVNWIEFKRCWFFRDGGGPWYPDGVYGIHYRLYAGVEANFRIVFP